MRAASRVRRVRWCAGVRLDRTAEHGGSESVVNNHSLPFTTRSYPILPDLTRSYRILPDLTMIITILYPGGGGSLYSIPDHCSILTESVPHGSIFTESVPGPPVHHQPDQFGLQIGKQSCVDEETI